MLGKKIDTKALRLKWGKLEPCPVNHMLTTVFFSIELRGTCICGVRKLSSIYFTQEGHGANYSVSMPRISVFANCCPYILFKRISEANYSVSMPRLSVFANDCPYILFKRVSEANYFDFRCHAYRKLSSISGKMPTLKNGTMEHNPWAALHVVSNPPPRARLPSMRGGYTFIHVQYSKLGYQGCSTAPL